MHNILKLFFCSLLYIGFFTLNAQERGTSVVDSIPQATAAYASQVDSVSAILEALQSQRASFQTYNDSIYCGLQRDVWIPFFLRRAKLYSQMYRDNSKQLRVLRRLLAATRTQDIKAFSDSVYFNKDYKQVENARLRLIIYLFYCSYRDVSQCDPFLFEELLEDLQPDVDRLMPHSIYAYLYYGTLARCNYLMTDMIDNVALTHSWTYYEKVLQFAPRFDEYRRLDSDLLLPYIHALFFSMDMQYVNGGILMPEESRMRQRVVAKELESHSDYFLTPQADNSYRWLREGYESYDCRFLSQTVWANNDSFHSDDVDGVARNFLDAYAQDSLHATLDMRMRVLRVRQYLGQISADEARSVAYSCFKDSVMPGCEVLNNKNIVRYFETKYTPLLYMNDKCSLPEEDKERCVSEVVEEMIAHLRACKNSQYGDPKAVLASYLLTSPYVVRHMSSAARVHYLHDMFVSCQVQTVAHSQMVSKLSGELLQGVLTYNPELLEGAPGVPSVSKLKKSAEAQKKLLQFMEDGAFCHDLGKITMAEIVKNDFRPLSDHEFDMLKKHPERGLQFLRIDHSLSGYRDLVVGHHKWYNGKHGYPEWFNNTASPYRIFIDILTICDCVEAATDQLGRRYSQAKNFKMIMLELKAGAGTRYNPDLVSLIDDNPRLYERMRYWVEEGWVSNYYDIYSTYFNN